MVISSIEKQKKNEKRYSVFIDAVFAFGLSDIDVLYYKLKEGEDITQEKLDLIIENVVITKARDAAYSFLSYKPRTYSEMVKKLQESDFSEEVIFITMGLLEEYNYINDQEYAEEYARNRMELKGYGKLRVSHELREKGIDKKIIQDVLEQNQWDEISSAVSLLEKRLRGDRDLDFDDKRKSKDYLLRRGFSFDVINKAFKEYLTQEG